MSGGVVELVNVEDGVVCVGVRRRQEEALVVEGVVDDEADELHDALGRPRAAEPLRQGVARRLEVRLEAELPQEVVLLDVIGRVEARAADEEGVHVPLL